MPEGLQGGRGLGHGDSRLQPRGHVQPHGVVTIQIVEAGMIRIGVSWMNDRPRHHGDEQVRWLAAIHAMKALRRNAQDGEGVSVDL